MSVVTPVYNGQDYLAAMLDSVLAQTWNEHIEETKQNRYGSRKLELPRPEFYVIFTGERQEKPEYLNLSKEFFDGKKGFLEARVKMLYGDGNGDIISQYVTFTKIYQEQARLLGRTVEAVRETIRICKDKDVLKEYAAFLLFLIPKLLHSFFLIK